MEESTDPNVPDSSNGDFFCRLCLASANSAGMWLSHIAGRRHIKNMQKFPNGMPQRLDDDDEFERPAKYGRYENDDYPDYPPRDKYYRRTTDYVPEIRPQVIDYGHKTILPEETSQPDSRRFEGIPLKEKPEDLIDKIFAGTKFDRKNKHFEEESSKKQADERIQRKWNSNNLKQSSKGMLYNDDFEKELDELLQNSSDHKGFKQKDRETFCKDKFKKQVDDLLLGKSRNRESEHRDVIILSDDDDDDDSKNYASHKNTNKRKIVDHGISKMKETEGKDKKMYDRESDKRYSKKKDKDFVDIFHKINDQKLFTMSVTDEPESRSSVKKSAKAIDSKLDDFDPDKLTPDAVDDLLTSYLKPKAGCSF